jgi:PKD repeat protein
LGWPAPFGVLVVPSNTTATVTYEWDFGDGSPHGASQYASHAFSAPGTYPWTLVVRAATAQATVTGSLTITGSMLLDVASAGDLVTIEWPKTLADGVLEQTWVLPSSLWEPCTNAVLVGPATYRVEVPHPSGSTFYRVRLVQ